MTNSLNAKTDFSATDSALGFIYQFRLALLLSLQRLRKNEQFSVYLETLDDVVFEKPEAPAELLQLKHHNKNAANLTDASSDFWKSLRIWIEGRASGIITYDASLYLVTTSDVGKNSSLRHLLQNNRDESLALKGLLRTAQTSENKTNQKGYKLFKDLGSTDQIELLKSIILFVKTPNIQDVENALLEELSFSVRRNHKKKFLERLEGWWFGEVLDQMIEIDHPSITSDQIEDKIDELRESFKRDALPLDHEILNINVDSNIYNEYCFVRQLRIAQIRQKKVIRAIQDFYFSSVQRSKWTREDLLSLAELSNYDNSLKEKWEIEFEDFTDDILEDATEQKKLQIAKEIYRWVERQCLEIRQITSEKLTRGSFHILSDKQKVGWHPDFEELLKPSTETQKR